MTLANNEFIQSHKHHNVALQILSTLGAIEMVPNTLKLESCMLIITDYMIMSHACF